MEYYDDLVAIWGGSPVTEPLPFGISSENINSNTDNDNDNDNDDHDIDMQVVPSICYRTFQLRNLKEKYVIQ